MRLALLLSLLALAACADAQDPAEPVADSAASSTERLTPAEPVPSAEPVVIADGRKEADASDLQEVYATWFDHPALQAAMRAAQTHWAAQDSNLDVELRVMDAAAGSFTEAGADEHAVLYSVASWPRCCPKVGVAIVRDDRLVRNVTFEGPTHDANAVSGLSGDGTDHLVLRSSFMMGGYMESGVSLVSLAGETPTGWGGAPVFESSCGASGPTETAMRLTATPASPGTPLAVSSEAFTRSCTGGEWAASSEPTSLSLEPDAADAYTVLAVE